MRKALVFFAVFALVLVAGAAVAFIATPGDDAVTGSEAIEKPDTVEEKEKPPTVEAKAEQEADKEPLAEEPVKEEPVKETEKEEAPKEEKPAEGDKDTTSPEIVILYPEEGQHFEERKVAFEGEVEPGSKVFAAGYEADVTKEGHWRIVLILTNDGANVATFKAVDEAGNKSEASVKVFYEGTKEEEKHEEGYKFTANQKWGSCSEPIPYDKWYGKGEPGTEIWIGNDWGSATTTIGKTGEWHLKVEFPGMPCGEHKVVLETNKGHRKVFEFTHPCGEGGDH